MSVGRPAASDVTRRAFVSESRATVRPEGAGAVVVVMGTLEGGGQRVQEIAHWGRVKSSEEA
jgi:hypothetical protein